MSQNSPAVTDDVSATDLTAFQMETLFAIARLEASEAEPYGLGIKRQLEDRIGEEINHGRLYPNLDELVTKGVVEKTELDKRTNRYTLTDEGEVLLRGYRDYVEKAVTSV